LSKMEKCIKVLPGRKEVNPATPFNGDEIGFKVE